MEEKLKNKLVQLNITVKRTGKILDEKNYEAIERHEKALKATIDEVDVCERAVEAEKIAPKQEVDEILKWVASVDEELAKADKEVSRLREYRNQIKEHDEQKAQEKELQFEHVLHETRMKFQAELKAAKTMDNQSDTKVMNGDYGKEAKAKLPKVGR